MDSVDLSQAVWRTSSRSASSGDCVEVAFVSDVTAVRDSKNPNGPALAFTLDQWGSFVGGVKAGRFDQR